MDTNREMLAKRISALSDPIRLEILDLLVKGHDAFCKSPPHPDYPAALCPYLDLQSKMGDIAPSKLSYHLKELRLTGLIEEHRDGKRVYYTVNGEVLAAVLEALRKRYLVCEP